MKKALLAGLLALTASAVMQAANCVNTSLSVLNGLDGGGCTYQGFTFSNFYVSGYNDFSYGGFGSLSITPSVTGYVNQTGQTNLQNWLVSFSGTAATGVTVTLSTNQNGWVLALPFGQSSSAAFDFEVKYTVAPPSAIQSITGTTVVNYQATQQPVTARETLLKASSLPSQTSVFIQSDYAGGANGIYTTSKSFNPGNTGNSTEITDNSGMRLLNDAVPTGTQSLGLTSISNTFTLVPEPMTLSLMGAGLVGFALLRRRSVKK